MAALRFFVDFDGTITTDDVVDMMLERFASPAWREVEKEWVEGRIGSRECLSRQIALVRCGDGEFGSFLKSVRIDPGFIGFLRTASKNGVPVSIVSDGFDLVIDQVLKNTLAAEPALLKQLPIFSNHLVRTDGSFQVQFPQGPACEHGCANCKARLIARDKKEGEFVVFIGDGLSDRYGAAASDLTFAKNKLLNYCLDNGIHHIAYSGFAQIDAWLTDTLVSRENQKGNPWQLQKKSS